MESEQARGYRTGETALIVTVPEAETLVSGWRSQFDTAAAAGVPAHVTVLAPFLDRRLIEPSVICDLELLVAEHRVFDLHFAQCRRFPDVLYLAPVPESQLRALTEAIFGRWPEAPPYGGQFADVVPHLTVAQGQEERVFDVIESDLSNRLPVMTRVSTLRLIAYNGDQWVEEYSFSLA